MGGKTQTPDISTTRNMETPFSAHRSSRHHRPLLALAPPALALGDEMLGDGDEEENVKEFWTVISKAADIVQDGDRLENLAWRQWCRHRTRSFQASSSSLSHNRRISISSTTTCSSTSILTPHPDNPPSPTHSTSSHLSTGKGSGGNDRRSFGGALKLLMEENHFKDWVSDAQKNLPLPTISVPDTPVANFEIRLVEPTPVPSRVGSLGGSIGAGGMLGVVGMSGVPLRLSTDTDAVQEVVEEEEEDDEEEEEEEEEGETAMRSLPRRGIQVQPAQAASNRNRSTTPARSPKKKSKFFLHSSPSKGSGSESATSPIDPKSPEPPSRAHVPQPPSPDPSVTSDTQSQQASQIPRQSSGSSAGNALPLGAKASSGPKKRSPAGKRNVSLSTMRGRFGAEKRKAAELVAQKNEEAAAAAAAEAAAKDEDSGWEDEVEEGEEVEEDYEDVQEAVEEEQKENAIARDAAIAALGGTAVVPNRPHAPLASALEQTTSIGELEIEDAEEDWSDEVSEQSDSRPTSSAQQHKSPVPATPSTAPKVKSPSPGPPASRPSYLQRTSSRSGRSNTSNSGLDLTALLTRTTKKNDRRQSNPRVTPPPSRDPPPPPAPTPLRRMSKRHQSAAKEERRRIEAELEAQKKREMFAKQQIFGTSGATGKVKSPTAEGLLSGMFKRGGSMVDLTSQNITSPPLRPSPTHVHLPSLTSLGKSPVGPALLRSKSAVAMPVQTGLSVSRISPKRSKLSEEIGSIERVEGPSRVGRMSRESDRTERSERSERVNSNERSERMNSNERSERINSNERSERGSADRGVPGGSSERKPPADMVLESDSSDDEDDYLATSSTQRKLAELAAKKQKRDKERSVSPPGLAGTIGGQPIANGQPIIQNGGPQAVRFDAAGVVMPMSPTTRRRAIISREMSESLRRGVILEREKSSGGITRKTSYGPPPPNRLPPSTHTSQMPTRGSSSNLAQFNSHPALARHRSDPHLNLQGIQHSPPSGTDHSGRPSPIIGPSNPSHPHAASSTGLHEPIRRRTQPNVLGGFLRPLTRVGEQSVISRTQSSANLTTPEESSGSPTPVTLEAPPMVRRSTEGVSPINEFKTEQERRRELARRRDGFDTSYRMHGW